MHVQLQSIIIGDKRKLLNDMKSLEATLLQIEDNLKRDILINVQVHTYVIGLCETELVFVNYCFSISLFNTHYNRCQSRNTCLLF